MPTSTAPDYNQLLMSLLGGYGGLQNFSSNSGFNGGYNSVVNPATGRPYNNQGGMPTVHDLQQNIDHWSPTIDANGNLTWANPNAFNPVPQANVPGASQIPGTTYINQASQVQAFQDLMPYIQQTANSQILPTALSNLQASAATSGGYNQLMTNLYGQYAPQLNAIGNAITGQNMSAYAGNQLNTLNGPGTDLLKAGYNASQIFDAPYYQARQATSDSLGKLLGSIDVSGNLSGSENNQIAQGLAREGVQRGTLNAPSSADAVSNAMQYGNASFQRKAAEQGILSSAINSASGFLPTSKSGVNVFDTGTGASMPGNPGAGMFQGINSNFGTNLATAAFGQTGQTGQTAMNNSTQMQMNQANIKANAKDWMDYLVQSSQIFSNIAGGVGGAAGACWVARKVFGENNGDWLKFRYWLLNKAPINIKELYLKDGERISEIVEKEPLLKAMLLDWMTSKINN